MSAASANHQDSGFEFSNAFYLSEFLFGTGATLLLTNAAGWKLSFGDIVRPRSTVQGAVEEVTEQFSSFKAARPS